MYILLYMYCTCNTLYLEIVWIKYIDSYMYMYAIAKNVHDFEFGIQKSEHVQYNKWTKLFCMFQVKQSSY